MYNTEPFAVSADGTEMHASLYGAGPPIVIVHGGLGEAAHWEAVGRLLVPPYRIIGVERRLYGRSGKPQSPHAMAREAEDIRAVLDRVGKPALLVGHSSGGVVALEAALLHPVNLLGMVLYEPPVQVGTPLGGDFQRLAEEALAAGDADKSLLIFFEQIVGFPREMTERMRSPQWRGGWEHMKTLLPSQLEDNRALRALPMGLERYRALDLPILLLRGTQSPAHLQERLAALADVLPHNRIVDLPGEAHNANMSAPGMVADAIKEFAAERFG